MSGWLISYQGNWQRCMLFTASLIRTVTSWGLRQLDRKITPVGSVQMKQALAEHSMVCRGQENSHLEWLDHTVVLSVDPVFQRVLYGHTTVFKNQVFYFSLVSQMVKNLPAVLETQVRCLGQEDPLEKRMAAQSSILAWEIPWTEEPGGLQSMGSQKWTQLSQTNTLFRFSIDQLLYCFQYFIVKNTSVSFLVCVQFYKRADVSVE